MGRITRMRRFVDLAWILTCLVYLGYGTKGPDPWVLGLLFLGLPMVLLAWEVRHEGDSGGIQFRLIHVVFMVTYCITWIRIMLL